MKEYSRAKSLLTKTKKRLLKRAAAVFVLFALMTLPLTLNAYAASCPQGGEHEYTVKLVRQATDTKDGLRTYTCSK